MISINNIIFFVESSFKSSEIKTGKVAYKYLKDLNDSVIVFELPSNFIEIYVKGDLNKFKVGQKEKLHIESSRGVDFQTFVRQNKLKTGTYKGTGEIPENFIFSSNILKGKFKIYLQKGSNILFTKEDVVIKRIE